MIKEITCFSGMDIQLPGVNQGYNRRSKQYQRIPFHQHAIILPPNQVAVKNGDRYCNQPQVYLLNKKALLCIMCI